MRRASKLRPAPYIITTSTSLRHAFSGNYKQLQRHDSVHLSSVYTDYSSIV